MTTEQLILFAIFVTVFGMFAWGRVRYDIVALGALLLGVVLGVVPSDQAFSGFGHPATIIVAMVLIASAGLTRSGAVGLITRHVIRSDRGVTSHIVILGGIGAALSGFINNIAALALLMPVDIQTAAKAKRAAGRTLMPLAFATILGGMITMIGTPPNIIVASIRQQELGAPFAMFDYTPVGLGVAIAGLIYVTFLGWRLIPQRDDGVGQAEDLADYVAELVVPEDSKLIGERLGSLDPAAEDSDVAILSLFRDGKRRRGPSRNAILNAGDTLLIEASPSTLEEFRRETGLAFPKGRSDKARIPTGEGQILVEAVAREDSRITGRTAQTIGLGWRQQTILMGISRRGRTIRDRARRTTIEPGDILLLLTPEDTSDHVVDWLGCLPLAGRAHQITDEGKAPLAMTFFAAAILAASFGLASMPVALGLMVVAFVVTRILPTKELYSHVDWPVIVLLGSMIPLGLALDSTGGTQIIASGLTFLTSGLPAWVSLLVLMVVTMTLSDILNNNATTIIAAPVGIRVAEQLQVNPDPYLMAVAVAASCAFLTPIGHQNNTVILGPGGYRFGDYWRMGLPLEALVVVVAIPLILLVWPL
ncbi:MAG: SLC13 family permease [Sediminimonas qiaohouensis]|uniref:SLC13 family permease n=1 Tax=Sediminimonas qiaohouensis TaxID=552061 RepID=A0A7C9H9C6_9RHOB|nr:SLC13 family permease [Sediminimonas qiaohouensis]MTJ03289.1 SLC13 family permease [Sediminimonas qiaohouensis]